MNKKSTKSDETIKWLSTKQARHLKTPCNEATEYGRNAFTRDYNQVIHSSFFRRLAHKTQVHTAPNNDHIRTRLTHSIETEQIGRQISRYFVKRLLDYKILTGENKYILDIQNKIEDLTAASCLAHDIGHAPFGHTGAKILNKKLNNLEFDDNKQVTRILLADYLYTDCEPSAAFICSLLKKHKTKDNAYKEDAEALRYIQNECGLANLRHPISYFMEAADDIAYITSDLSDYIENINSIESFNIFSKDIEEYLIKIPYVDYKYNPAPGKSLMNNFNNIKSDYCYDYIQVFCSNLIKSCLRNVFDNIDSILCNTSSINELPVKMKEYFDKKNNLSSKNKYNLLLVDSSNQTGTNIKSFKDKIYNSHLLKHEGIGIRDLTADNILNDLIEEFGNLTSSHHPEKETSFLLLPKHFQDLIIYSSKKEISECRSRIVLDFISGMTDRYAIKFWEKIKYPSNIYKYVA